MITLKEREERKKVIGASEIHKLLNFDTQELQDLWELKIGLKQQQELENDSIEAGNILEEEGLNYFSKTNKVELILNERIANKDNPFIVCSYDARISDTKIPVENKIIKEEVFKDWQRQKQSDVEYLGSWYKIPKAYYCQLQIQIDTSDTEFGILNVNTLTDEEVENPLNVIITDIHNKQLKIYRDNEIIEELKERAKYFESCIKYKKRPSELEYTNLTFEKI